MRFFVEFIVECRFIFVILHPICKRQIKGCRTVNG